MSGPRQRKKPRRLRHRFSSGGNSPTTPKRRKAFAAPHGERPYDVGYRFDTPDPTTVISGDTRPDGAIPQKCRGCNGPVPEVYTQASLEKVSPPWKQYRLAYHTWSKELAEISTRAQPGWLVLYPRGNPGCDQAWTMSAGQQSAKSDCCKKCDRLTREKWSQVTISKFTDAQRWHESLTQPRTTF
jgi:ribonuclease BN (tRNA processing enzyme)